MTIKKLAQQIAELLLDNQAEEVLVLHVKKLTTLADYFIIATGSVDVHVKGLVDHVQRSLADLKEPVHALRVEGYSNLSWVLIDFGDIIVHVFQPETREYYQLEKLWGDAPVMKI
ncbi:MAG: ribosome silencing factor [Candidatus Electryonea clarkiae]|nr:ribosome silencing factor [Candidatus Electryonea clarkiae]MDP8288667.1 ribosome silencing factor [Candidatus Electryonea clarkiae]